jgi:hypothetical protein
MFGMKNNNNRKFLKCIKDLRKIDNREMHFNIYRINGEVVCQMVRYKFIKNWDYAIEFNHDDGFVLLLQFIPEKTNNEDNYNRFLTNGYNRDFVAMKEIEIPSYAYFFEMDKSDEFIVKRLMEITTTIYGDIKKVRYEVRGFD